MITLSVDGTHRVIEPDVLIVAGYTGADATAVEHHIDELAAEGVAPPPLVPMYWSMPPSLLDQRPAIEMPSTATSGEIEIALVVTGSEMVLAAGSDHTCREAEATDIRLSKLICPTPLSNEAWPWDEVSDHWTELELASTIEVDGASSAYQSASAGGNRSPQELLAGIPWTGPEPDCFVLLCGTVPAIGGIRPADRFTGSITDPRTRRSLHLDYHVVPVAALGP